MPIVRVEIWAGDNGKIKKNLGRAITDIMVENTGCPPHAVTVIFEEVPKENWAIGGQLCSEIFKGEK